MNKKIQGTGVALVTPFNESGDIDFAGLNKLLAFTAEKGADYYVVMGTTGESATTTNEEKFQVLDFVKKNNVSQLPIVYGIGGNNTAQVLENINNTDLTGVSALLSVSPYYNKPSQEGIYQHFISIADHCPIPVILYNVPGRTASNITAETTLRLSAHPNIIGIKESSGDLVQAMEIAKNKPADFALISGEDLLTLPLMSIGATGVISVLANAFSDIMSGIVNAAVSNDLQKAQSNLYKLLKINDLMYEESNPVGIKQVLTEMGICNNFTRLPLLSASEKLQEEIKKVLALIK